MKRVILTLSAVVLACGVAYGQQQSGPNYKHLKPMEWLIGTWVAETEAPEDTPENFPFAAKKGDAIKLILVAEWGLNKNVIRSHFTMTVNNELALTAEGTMGWAADKNQIIESSFDTTGGRGETVYNDVSENAFQGSSRDVSPDGTVTESIITVTVNDDTITAKKTNITVGAEKKPDEPPLEFKRKK